MKNMQKIFFIGNGKQKILFIGEFNSTNKGIKEHKFFA